ncbi:nucleotide exchange factor GrpE [Geminocystis sp. GBBB08]|uniref:nucleotide exchange factor GrpE n=1 Tax=Geminocystis sp. GBBB08 TaxID=2604140 RepID=UPI0027E2C773|nr:nucleotide exchange factor GrpE [Geminocystis sp. GBBB08]MBL1208897.1 nucleotide exchange factor GrpE [Geminocystis sp. GBBB08]
MSETDNYADLEKKMDIADNLENSPETGNTSSISETEFKSDQTDNESINEEAEKSSPPQANSSEEKDLELETNAEESVVEESLIDEATQAQISSLEAEIASLKAELEVQNEQFKSVQGQYMRLTADFDNFRRRTSKEKEELEHIVKKKTILELLPVVDNFERARTQLKPSNDGEMTIHKSYQGVYKTFVDSLKKIGVSAMRPEGEPFDPNYHEAMLREPTKEYEEGIIMEQLVRGYLLHDEVLRYAMVKVAAAPAEDESTEAETTDVGSENN